MSELREYRAVLREELRRSASAIAYWLEQPHSDPSRDKNLRYLFRDVAETKLELRRIDEAQKLPSADPSPADR